MRSAVTRNAATAPLLEEIEIAEPVLSPHEDKELAAKIRKKIGSLPTSAPYLMRLPWLARALFLLETSTRGIPVELGELVKLVVSQDNSCRYCYGMQRFMLRAVGYGQARVRELERDLYMTGMDTRERLALDFARKISRANPRPGEGEIEALHRAGYDDLAVAELAYVAAFTCFMNRVATAFSLPPESIEQLSERWFFPLLRPLMRMKMRAGARSAPTALPADLDGPWAELILKLEGSPCAPALAQLIDDALASDVLPRRAKLVVFAVVARTIGCMRMGPLVEGMLLDEGLTREGLAGILAHLSSPELTPLEAELVPFARETVRYRYDAIQSRTREFARGHTPEETLEAIGIAALANALTRLSILLEHC